jgi:glycine/D-amino acid oxidase-like deaminating enzyme
VSAASVSSPEQSDRRRAFGRVGWDDDPIVTRWARLPALDGDRHADACVVGLGASGLAAIEALTNRGLSVVGVDAGRVAAGAAGRNGGFLLGGPALFLHDAIARWGADDAVGLYRETLAELDRLAALLGPDVVRRVGSIRLAGLPGEPADGVDAGGPTRVGSAAAVTVAAHTVAAHTVAARDRQAETADIAEHEAALRAHGIAVERYDGPLGQGIFLPDDAAMNPARRALELAGRLRGRAALYERTAVREVASGAVVTGSGTVRAPLIVVAVDGRLEQLVPALRGRVRTARLQMLRTAPVAQGRLPCPVYCRWGYDYAQQTADGALYVGGGRDRFIEDEWTSDTNPSWQVQAEIERVAERMAGGTGRTGGTGGTVTVTHRWAASVGYPVDGRPVCTEAAPGVIAVGGYSGTGNLVGPVAARAAVALALDGTTPPGYLST